MRPVLLSVIIGPMKNILTQAIEEAGGITAVAAAVGKTYVAVYKWTVNGQLPRTEWTGETNYARIIERLTKGKFKRKQLLVRNVA